MAIWVAVIPEVTATGTSWPATRNCTVCDVVAGPVKVAVYAAAVPPPRSLTGNSHASLLGSDSRKSAAARASMEPRPHNAMASEPVRNWTGTPAVADPAASFWPQISTLRRGACSPRTAWESSISMYEPGARISSGMVLNEII